MKSDTNKWKTCYTDFTLEYIMTFTGDKIDKINKGYDNANDVQIRIPYGSNIDIANFSIGDIVVQGTLNTDIETQEDLNDYLIYNITSINDNNFGNNPHIHLGGK